MMMPRPSPVKPRKEYSGFVPFVFVAFQVARVPTCCSVAVMEPDINAGLVTDNTPAKFASAAVKYASRMSTLSDSMIQSLSLPSSTLPVMLAEARRSTPVSASNHANAPAVFTCRYRAQCRKSKRRRPTPSANALTKSRTGTQEG